MFLDNVCAQFIDDFFHCFKVLRKSKINFFVIERLKRKREKRERERERERERRERERERERDGG